MDPGRSDLHGILTALRSDLAPALSSEDVARQISTLTNLSSLQSSDGVSFKDVETTGPGLTLIAKILCKLSSKQLQHDVCGFYQDVIQRLFNDPALTSGLVRLLSFQDRLLSHLAAKCVSSWAVYDICSRVSDLSLRKRFRGWSVELQDEAGDCNPVWMATFPETFQTSAPGCALDTHLGALTEVVKGVLRADGADKRELLMKLLSPFESPLASLYSELFEKRANPVGVEKQGPDSDLELCVCALLDLLEVLTAARTRHGLSSTVQRLTFLRTAPLVRLTCSDLEEFAKKRALLLLKRTLVRKAGDDLRLGGAQSSAQDRHYPADALAMADCVLRQVEGGWLRGLRVKPQASYFGGNREQGEDGEEERDGVTLRAVSLILIKSLEIKSHSVRAQGPDRYLGVQLCLVELLNFLQRQVPRVKALTHCCSWISVLFTEQDDDLMEAVKALTALDVYQRSLPSSEAEVEACNWGCNPHCHFILLLQSLGFDHSVLLDFLISTETCFLEYCVIYLKHLRHRWQDFCDACRRIEDSETHTPPVPSVSGASPSCSGVSRPHSAPLVDYEVSDESEEEDAKVSDVRLKRKTSPDSSEGLVKKVVSCLTTLKNVISRLHSKGLFPYKPDSLLKLLTAVEDHL